MPMTETQREKGVPKDTEQNGMTPYPPQHTLVKAEGLKKEVPLIPPRRSSFPP